MQIKAESRYLKPHSFSSHAGVQSQAKPTRLPYNTYRIHWWDETWQNVIVDYCAMFSEHTFTLISLEMLHSLWLFKCLLGWASLRLYLWCIFPVQHCNQPVNWAAAFISTPVCCCDQEIVCCAGLNYHIGREIMNNSKCSPLGEAHQTQAVRT